MITNSARLVLAGMCRALESFQVGSSVDPLDRVVGEFAGPLDALVGQMDGEWLEELRSAWWSLEYVNAIVLGGGRSVFDDSERATVVSARKEMLALLVEVMAVPDDYSANRSLPRLQ